VNRRYFIFAIALFSLGSVGCDDGSEAPGPTIVQTLSFIADGSAFSAANGGVVRAGNTVTISGQTSTSGTIRTISIELEAVAAGTFAVGGADSPVITYSEQASNGAVRYWSADVGVGSGTVVFTQLSATRAIGTFLATLPPVTASGATAAKVITSGSFDLTF
jgi:hypothetical protein